MQLHDPYSTATPSQRLAAEARHIRLGRIAQRAVVDTGIVLRPAQVEPEPVDIGDDDWAERQKKIPLPKAPWFEIIAEIAAVEPTRPTIEQIQRACCEHYELSRTDFLAPRRTAYIVFARQVAMYLCKALTLRTLPEIGRRFVHRDHTTVLYSVRKITALMSINPILSAEVELLKLKIAEQIA